MNNDQHSTKVSSPTTDTAHDDIHDNPTYTPRAAVHSPSGPNPVPPTKRRKHLTPNYRDYAPDEDPLSPRRFTTASGGPPPSHSKSHTAMALNGVLARPSMEMTNDEEWLQTIPEFDPRHPPQLSEVAAEAFNAVIQAEAFASSEDGIARVPSESMSNFSQCGIVHLAPIESLSPLPLRMGSSSSSGQDTTSISPIPSTQGDADVEQASSNLLQGSLPSPPAFSSASRTSDPSSGNRSTGESISSGSDGPQITFRYEHVEDEHGHHLVVGREGTLTKCEDEVRVHEPCSLNL